MTQPTAARCRTTDRSSDSFAPRGRGALLIRLDKEMTWLAPHQDRPGRPPVFSGTALQVCLSVKVLFRLPAVAS